MHIVLVFAYAYSILVHLGCVWFWDEWDGMAPFEFFGWGWS